jgi:hypothetical protein
VETLAEVVDVTNEEFVTVVKTVVVPVVVDSVRPELVASLDV